MTMSWLAADWINEGAKLIAQDPRLGVRLLRQGVCLGPDLPLGWFNLGLALHQQRRITEAIRAYRLSLEHPSGHELSLINNLAQDLLLSGAMAEGWRLYEQRRALEKHTFFHEALGFSWSGPEDPRGRPDTLLLVSEQGFGDTLQFSRFGLELQELGYQVELFCQRPLVPLLQQCSDLHAVNYAWQPSRLSGTVAWVPLMSLPHRLGRPTAPWPYPSGYLRVGPELVARAAVWRERLQRRPGHSLIGLHWQGNPKHEGSLYSRGRSMPFEVWGELIPQLPRKLEFVSLQKGEGSEQFRRDLGLPFVSGQDVFSQSMDFLDTAAVVQQCDLVLSADSGVVHLAGAMGVPTWVALPWIPEWRWGLSGQTTPWYGSLRLYRQPSEGDWRSVVRAMSDELPKILPLGA